MAMENTSAGVFFPVTRRAFDFEILHICGVHLA